MDKEGKKFCLDLTEEELLKWCLDNGFPKFRAGQIRKWLDSGVTETSRMTNVPAAMRQKLEEDFIFSSMKSSTSEKIVMKKPTMRDSRIDSP